MSRASYAVYVTFADGNPTPHATGLTAAEACAHYRDLRRLMPHTPPAVGIVDGNDEERGWFDPEQLEDAA